MQHVFLESHNIKNPFFGFGQFNYHLINGIYQIAPEDFKMSLHVKDTNKWKAHYGDYYKLKKYFSVRRYPEARLRKRYDLWHAMNQNTKIEPYHDIPYLLTVHNITFIKDQEKYMEKEVHQRFQEKLNRSTAITYISKYAKTSTHEFFEVPDVPEYIIYNGNPINDIQLSSIYKPSFVPQRPFLFSIGEFTQRKNFKTLIEMLRVLPEYDLVIAGKNTTKIAEELKSLVNTYNLKNEAMRFGKPVITSNNTSLPEIGGDIAFYWEHYDPEYMAQTVNQSIHTFDQNKEQNSSKSIAHAQSFNWKNAAQSYIDVYRNILNS